MKSTIGGILLLLAAGLMAFTGSAPQPEPAPKPPDDNVVVNDIVHRSYSTREKLFRNMCRQIAAEIDSGKLSTPEMVWAAIESGDLLVIEKGSEELRKAESAALTPYSLEKHSEILKGYADGIRN